MQNHHPPPKKESHPAPQFKVDPPLTQRHRRSDANAPRVTHPTLNWGWGAGTLFSAGGVRFSIAYVPGCWDDTVQFASPSAAWLLLIHMYRCTCLSDMLSTMEAFLRPEFRFQYRTFLSVLQFDVAMTGASRTQLDAFTRGLIVGMSVAGASSSVIAGKVKKPDGEHPTRRSVMAVTTAARRD